MFVENFQRAVFWIEYSVLRQSNSLWFEKKNWGKLKISLSLKFLKFCTTHTAYGMIIGGEDIQLQITICHFFFNEGKKTIENKLLEISLLNHL